MKTKVKVCVRAVSVLLTVMMFMFQLPIYAVSLQNDSEPAIEVSSAQARPDGEFSVDISFKNNPGIAAALIRVSYDETLLTMSALKYGEAFEKNGDMPPELSSGTVLLWNDLKNLTGDAVFATLTFHVNADAPGDATTKIEVTYAPSDIIDLDENDVSFNVINGVVDIVNGIAGDINMDGDVNTKDLLRLRKFFAGWDVEVDIIAVDCNGDGETNAKDLVRFRRWLAGHDVEIYYGKIKQMPCDHPNMTATEAKAATCVEDGNIAYWYCSKCHKYFSDIVGSTEIKLSDTVIEKTGEHTVVIDPAVAPTSTECGWTEGSHCSVCGTVIVERKRVEPIPEVNKYFIDYKPSYNDSYLSTIDFESQIPDESRSYTSENGQYELPILKADGYNFLGWSVKPIGNNDIITFIPKGQTGTVTLYAQWSIYEYSVDFISTSNSTEAIQAMPDAISYTVNKGISAGTLSRLAPQIPGYRWLGWSDENGNLIEKITKGTSGDITLYTNWVSDWNRAVPFAPKDYKDPAILEEDGKYIFAYHIGDIENVVLEALSDSKYCTVGQPAETFTITTEETIGSTEAKSVAETIAQATTKTSTWYLSKDWNSISSVSREHSQESSEYIDTVNQQIASGSKSISLTEDEGASENRTVNWGLNAKLYGKNTTELGASAKFPIKCVDIGVSAKNTTEIGGELNGHYEDTTVNNSYWNTHAAYDQSSSYSRSSTVSSGQSKTICEKLGINNTYSTGGSESQQEAVAVANTNEESYVSSFSYVTNTTEKVTKEVKFNPSSSGHWRQVNAGKVNVIAVVVYDIQTSTYSVFTHGVLDANSYVKESWQKSMESSSFEDNQNMVIPFEVPGFVHDYVNNAVGYSNGLEVDKDTGVVTKYTGDAEHIHIPDYYTISNGDGTYTAVKVKGIDPRVFENNTAVKSVRLGKYITEIPEKAFSGCTALKTVEYEKLTAIGAYAFSGCISLDKFTVDTNVTSLGSKAFENVPEIEVKASNSDVVKNATSSGAKSISIYLKDLNDELKDTVLVPPSSVESYALYGRDRDNKIKSYSNLKIDSKALSTTVNGMRFVNNSGVALKFSSDNVTLSEVTVQDAPGFAMIFTADTTNIYLMDKSNVSSLGANTILAHGAVISKAPGTNSATSLTLANGQLLFCAGFEDSGKLYSGAIKSISQTEYEQILNDSLPWVLESEMPSGATVINSKWTYDQVTNITSDKSHVEGYTLYDTTSKWGDYGPWSGWSKSSASESDSRLVETRTIAATYKTQYNYNKWTQYSNGTGVNGPTQNTWSGVWCGYEQWYGWTDTPLSVWNTQWGYGVQFNLYGSNGNSWYNQITRQVELTPAYKEYRYKDRSLIYTYYHTKTEALESNSIVSNGAVSETETISNVQKWVQYTVK